MLNLQLKHGINEKEYEIVLNGLLEYNGSKVPFTQEKGAIPVNLTYRDEQDTIVAAVVSRIYYNILEVFLLWVHPDYRGQNLGKRLLLEAEAMAKEKNCALVHLNTDDFQAPEFYKKLGYVVFGELENAPLAGHKIYFLKKDI